MQHKEVVLDLRSRIWVTYRKGFEEIGELVLLTFSRACLQARAFSCQGVDTNRLLD